MQQRHRRAAGPLFVGCAQRVDGYVEAADRHAEADYGSEQPRHAGREREAGQDGDQAQAGVAGGAARAEVADQSGRERKGAGRAEAAAEQHDAELRRVQPQRVADRRNARRPRGVHDAEQDEQEGNRAFVQAQAYGGERCLLHREWRSV